MLKTGVPSDRLACVAGYRQAEFQTFQVVIIQGDPRELNIYMGNTEILVRKPHASRHSVWEDSENMGCVLRRCNFASLFSLFSWFGCTSPTTLISLVLCVSARDFYPGGLFKC